MRAERSPADRIAEALREPPELDAMRRARLEAKIVQSSRARHAPRRQVAIWAIAVAALVLGGVVVSALLTPSEPEIVATFTLSHDDAVSARGALGVGATMEVGDHDRARIEIGATDVQLRSRSRLRVLAIEAGRTELELSRGIADLAFHPGGRGQQLIIHTTFARVEVVGTELVVDVSAGSTRVEVLSGRVRVVPIGSSGSVVMVGAGEHVEIGRASETRAASEPASEGVGSEVGDPVAPAVQEAAPAAETEPIAPEPIPDDDPPTQPAPGSRARPGSNEPTVLLTPRQRLLAVRALLEGGSHALAREELELLARASSAPLAVRLEAQTLLAESLQATGALAEAAAAYAEVTELGRGRAEAHVALFALARLEERGLGDAEAARTSYLRYLEEAPSGPHAELARRAVCRLGGAPGIDCAPE